MLAQHRHSRLIAQNLASIESIEKDSLYKEFLAFKASQKNQSNTQVASSSQTGQNTIPSYAKIVEDDESDDFPYFQHNEKEVILLLEDDDIRRKNDVWDLFQKYLDKDTGISFTVGSYKGRAHFEQIPKATDSWEITHFRAGKIYTFSKAIIKRVITASEWGLSTLKEKEYLHADNKTTLKFNYWDYVEAFHRVLLYQNPSNKHTWFLKFCQNIYRKDFPNWLYQWWQSFGPSINILPGIFKELYSEWVEISPKLIEAQHNNKWVEGMPISNFFIEFGIPYILKWDIEFGHTKQNIPCIHRTFSSKFWKKMMRNNEHGILEAQSTIDSIKSTLDTYRSVKIVVSLDKPFR